MPDTLTQSSVSASVVFVASRITLYCVQSEPLFETPYTAYFASADGANPASRVVPPPPLCPAPGGPPFPTPLPRLPPPPPPARPPPAASPRPRPTCWDRSGPPAGRRVPSGCRGPTDPAARRSW